MKFNELAKKSPKELNDLRTQLKEELFHLRIKSKTAQLTKKHQLLQVRKDLARVQHKIAQLAAPQTGAKA